MTTDPQQDDGLDVERLTRALAITSDSDYGYPVVADQLAAAVAAEYARLAASTRAADGPVTPAVPVAVATDTRPVRLRGGG